MSACTTYALKNYSQKDMLSVQVTEVSEHDRRSENLR